MKEYFHVSASEYVEGKNFDVVRPASLNHPKDNAVMFIMSKYSEYIESFRRCRNCLIFWPDSMDVPPELKERHAIVLCESSRAGYCSFFRDHHITYYPMIEEYNCINGAFIAASARIGDGCRILPGAYIGGEVEIGENCYIGAGAKLVGEIHIGNNVVIRENAVIGADGLSTDRDQYGRALTMPQFGGVVIEDNVQIGALTVIARGAIDNTIIKRGSKIDNSSFISHNVIVGEDTFIVGETIMFGGSSTGSQVLISGNSAIRNGKSIGDKAIVGMGSVVVRDVQDGTVVKGNPAK